MLIVAVITVMSVAFFVFAMVTFFAHCRLFVLFAFVVVGERNRAEIERNCC